MSGQQIGTVVGGIIGAYFGMPQLGAAIGGYIGGVIDPTVIKGPSIGDAQQQSSLAGQPIPKCYGHCPPIAPTLIDGDKIARKIKIEQGGKGSTTVTEQEGFIATRAFLVCEGEADPARIFRNGKLVYSTQEGDNIDADSAAFASQMTWYRGTETQGPDPSLEAIHGVGNTPYYRGRSYFVVRNDDETQTGGAANQYRIEVLSSATVNGETGGIDALSFGPDNKPWAEGAYGLRDPRRSNVEYEYAYYPALGAAFAWRDTLEGAINDSLAEGADPTYYGNGDVRGWSTQYYETGDGVAIAAPMFPWDETVFDPSSSYMLGLAISRVDPAVELLVQDVAGDSVGACGAFSSAVWARTNTPQGGGSQVYQYEGAAGGSLDFYCTPDNATRKISVYPDIVIACRPKLNCGAGLPYGAIAIPDAAGYWINPDGTKGGGSTCTIEAGTFKSLGQLSVDHENILRKSLGPALASVDANYYSQAFWDAEYAGAVAAGELPAGLTYQADGLGGLTKYPTLVDAACRCYPSHPQLTANAAIWKDIVSDIALRANAQLPSKLDIAIMTDEVPGFVLGNATLTGTDYVRTLCTFYLVDLPEYDGKLHAIRRGGPVVATLSEDDLLTVEDDDDDTRNPELLAYQRVTVMYPDPANNYVPTPQTSPRTSPDVTTTNAVTLQCPIPFGPDRMAQMSDILQKIAFLQVEGGFKRSFPAEFSKYVASDPIVFNNRRHMITKASNDDSMVRFECTYDRPSAYTSTATGSVAPPPEPPTSNIKGPTVFAAMNLPALNSSQSVPGMVLAASGVAAGWPGADIYLSLDGGVTEQKIKTIVTSGRIGTLVAPVGVGEEPFVVRMYANEILETVTPEQVASKANAFAVTTNRVSEIGRFQTASENASGNFDLTNIIRADLGTVEAKHVAGDLFVMLADAQFLPIDAFYAGRTLIFRAVTLGTAAANNATFSVIYDPQFTAAPAVAFLTTSSGSKVTTDTGEFIQVISE